MGYQDPPPSTESEATIQFELCTENEEIKIKLCRPG